MPASLEQRGQACARFIDDILADIAQKEGFSSVGGRPSQQSDSVWNLNLHARGIKSQIELFTEPGRFSETKSPFEFIAPASPLLEALNRVFADPKNELEKFHEQIPIWESHVKVSGQEINSLIRSEYQIGHSMPELMGPAHKQHADLLGQLMYMRGVLRQHGIVYSLTWHWIQHEMDQTQKATDEARLTAPAEDRTKESARQAHPKRGRGLTEPQIAFIQGAGIAKTAEQIIDDFYLRFNFKVTERTVRKYRNR